MGVLFLLTLLLGALMPGVPEPTDPRAIAFGAASGLLMFVWLVRRLMRKMAPWCPAGSWLTVFLMLVGLSALTAQWIGTPFDLWLRGAVPFLFLSLFFPAYELARRDAHWVVDVLGLSAAAWLGNIALTAGMAVRPSLRWSFGAFAKFTRAVPSRCSSLISKAVWKR